MWELWGSDSGEVEVDRNQISDIRYQKSEIRNQQPVTSNQSLFYDHYQFMQNNQNILFIGDSLTEWFNLKMYFPEASIINEGIAGDTTYGLLERLEAILDVTADKIFLLIGINDVWRRLNELLKRMEHYL